MISKQSWIPTAEEEVLPSPRHPLISLPKVVKLVWALLSGILEILNIIKSKFDSQLMLASTNFNVLPLRGSEKASNECIGVSIGFTSAA